MNVFYANSRQDTEEEVQDAMRVIVGRLVGSKVTSGKADFLARFPPGTTPNWGSWTTAVSIGINYGTQRPNYDVFIVPAMEIGKATADIVNAAISAGKPCLFWNPNDPDEPREIATTERTSESWKGGWRLVLRR